MYEKLKKIEKNKPVKLVECFQIKLAGLNDEFIEYDATYYKGNVKKRYPLPAGPYLLLFFVDANGTLFTTIRRQTPRKTEYYNNAVGDSFEVVVGAE